MAEDHQVGTYMKFIIELRIIKIIYDTCTNNNLLGKEIP